MANLHANVKVLGGIPAIRRAACSIWRSLYTIQFQFAAYHQLR